MQDNSIASQLFAQHVELNEIKANFFQAFEMLKECFENKKKVLVCGNGGSASDADHIVGELMKGFQLKRPLTNQSLKAIAQQYPEELDYFKNTLQNALPAISLNSHTALISAYANDIGFDMVYAQQVYGYAQPGDVLIGISTSGNAKSIINAVKVARCFGVKTIAMTNTSGGTLAQISQVLLNVPAIDTYKTQEYHIILYHALCLMLEDFFFNA